MKFNTARFRKPVFSNISRIIATIVATNIKLLFRTKASLLIILLGPLLLIFLAGIAFDNTNLYAVTVGTYSEHYNTLSKSFIDKLHEKQFKTKPYSSEENCITAIKEGTVHACVIFAPNFTLAHNKSNEITFYLDYSKLNLVWAISNVITTQISTRSRELSTNLTTQILRALEFTQNQITKRKQSMASLIANNDEASRRLYEISLQLAELDLGINPEQLGLNNLTSKKNRVQHWIDNSVNLGESSLQESLKYINSIDDLIKASSISADLKTNLHEYLKTTVNDISILKERLTTTQTILAQESTEFDNLISSIINRIQQTKNKIDDASNIRALTLEEINVIKTLLDKVLINILEVQKSLNDIDRVISTLQVTDPGSIVEPIITTIKPVTAEKSYLNYLFPTLIIIVIMYTALLLAPLLVLLERNSPVYVRNFMTPVTDTLFISSTFITIFVLLAAQTTIIITIALLFSPHLFNTLIITLIASGLAIAFFSFAGMLIGHIFNTEETAVLTSTSFATLLLFLSDVIIPIESMAPWLGSIASYNPFVIANTLLRKIIVLNASILGFWPELLLLCFYSILALILVMHTYRFAQQKTITTYIAHLPSKEKVLSKIHPKILKILKR